MAEILIPRRTKIESGYELLADITVGTATTQVDITGLNIGKGDEIVLVSDITNAFGVDSSVVMYVNSNYTNTNYYCQELNASATSVTSGRYNVPYFGSVFTSKSTTYITNIKLTNSGYFVFQSNVGVSYGTSSIYIATNYVTSNFTATSITSLAVKSLNTNVIGAGSRFQLYKTGGA